MIDLRTDYLGEAYYWRAFNQHVRKEFASARVDIETSKRSGATDKVYTLAGIIRHMMPYLDPGSLTDEEAQHVAAYINSKPRPAYPFKERDYLTEALPVDSVYYPKR